MQGTLKYFLERIRQRRNAETRSIDSFCNERQMDHDSSVTRETATQFNKIDSGCTKNDDLQPLEGRQGRKFVCPNVATCLVIILLVIVFIVLPVVYLLHCFDLLSSKWPKDELRYVVTDHSHSNPRLELSGNENLQIRSLSGLNHLSVHKKTIKSRVNSELPNPPTPSLEQCSGIVDDYKFDCYPENGVTEESCISRGCCWIPRTNESKVAPLDVPYCFYPQNYSSYKVINTTEVDKGYIVYLERVFKSPYPDDVPVIRIDVTHAGEDRLRLKIYDPNSNRYEPPVPEVISEESFVTNPHYDLHLDGGDIKILRRNTNNLILGLSITNMLVFAGQFLQLSMLLPAGSSIYGLGEHRSTFKLSYQWQRFTMFNHDTTPQENMNIYGSQPFCLVMDEHKNSSGIFLLNSNAMEVILQPAPAITFRTIGGIFDFYVFLGPSPSDVVRQYQDAVGRPFMPPYWGLGFHICRFGYKTLNYTKEVLERNLAAGIPIDVQWNDLDYMNDSNDFTYDKTTFAGLPEFVEDLHERGMHYIPLIDPGISSGQEPGTYKPYDDGLKMGIFVKNSSGQPFEGKVWNRVSTVWPDFTNPNTTEYWLQQFKDLFSMFQYDGAWIDMNEPSNFYSGSITGCPNTTLNYPPYTPAVDGGDLFYRTLCMSSKHYIGDHYDLHNIYGLTEAITTNFALTEIRGKRPFIISRSTFSGFGHFAGHWSGDIASEWYDMKKTIPELLSFSLFGVPLMGADVCGFNGNTTAALCQRWMQLGAFYPFSRNHNTDNGIPQDPVALGSEVVESARKSLHIRYWLLPYLYSLFWRAHVFGDTVSRPLFFEFPEDDETLSLDEQFLWGPWLMIVPVLEENKTEVSAYLPNSLWYDLHTMNLVPAKGKWYTLDAPLDTIPLLIRGGAIIPAQVPNTTTTFSRKNDFDLIVAADESGNASGYLYWDDGDSLNSYEDGKYNLLNFSLTKSKLSGETVWWGYDEQMMLGTICILGVTEPVNNIFVNNDSRPFLYNDTYSYLKVENIKISLNGSYIIHWN